MRAGEAAVRVGGTLLLAGEVRSRPRAGGISAGIGTEYRLLPSFVVRGGYSSSMGQAVPASPMAGLGFGLSLRKATMDYAITPQGNLGQAQRVSVSTRF
ncbi:MAG: hypothetical protein HY553_13280 [Elusimicrobia bacterium]|nr:hypothetical protein [Elusimicrobiota bacterium]